MKKIFKSLLLLAVALGAAVVVGCQETPEPEPEPGPGGGNTEDPTEDPGVYGVKDAENSIDNYGGEITVKFLTLGDWTVESDADWCVIDTLSGQSGNGVIVVKVLPNADDELERDATITINVADYMDGTVLCTIHQSIDANSEAQRGDAGSLWVSDIMTERYLWNDEFIKVKSGLNYFSTADVFLNNALTQMDIEEDGSHYVSGERYYYTTIEVYMYTQSAAMERELPEYAPMRIMSTRQGFGINMLYPVTVTSTKYYLLVASVIDDSPADMAGIRRGQYITEYNGSAIDGSTLDEAYYTLMDQMTTTSQLTLAISEYETVGTTSQLVPQGNVSVSPTNYSYNPVVFKGVFQNNDATTQVGYLVYSEFEMGGDEQLLQAFQDFKNNGADEVILDLRYNTGGDVYSSAVLGTALVGSAHKGEVYCHMEFNEYRKAKGEVEYFYIGENPSMAEYPNVAEALNYSLDLPRVYVIATGFTASASELVINGLRGMGVEVILIGETTEGKNSGMEVTSSQDTAYSEYDFGNYVYVFAPITFYNRNAQGFKDFHSGFEPDYSVVETKYILQPWGNMDDPCLGAALTHIFYGSWPEAAPAKAMSKVAPNMSVVSKKGLAPAAKGMKVYSNEMIESYRY